MLCKNDTCQPLLERVVARMTSQRKGDGWFMKHRLLEVIPTFVMRGEKYVIVECASFLKHDNWMIRQAATEALGHLMTRSDIPLPHCASKPGTRTNSRPASPGTSALRPANSPAKPRLQHGYIVDEAYGEYHPTFVKDVSSARACSVYSDHGLVCRQGAAAKYASTDPSNNAIRRWL